MSKQILAVLIMVLVTYLPRALPILLFKKELESKFLKSLLFYMPYAVLGAMIFPSILYSTGSMLPAAVGMVVALILAYFNKGLMKVATGAILAVYVSQNFL
ncbi:hypothetical protein SH2C18_50510 [Clostridium sediminicola]|uniref:AzlD domain-containing protein n=1 Tax=Clostridium sediminicola TaxID=3114879 RepID=UPI0031F23B53